MKIIYSIIVFMILDNHQTIKALSYSPYNNTHQKTAKNNFGTTTIHHFNDYGKNISVEEVNSYGQTLWIVHFHDNGTQKKITYHVDKTKTIDYFDAYGKNSSRIEVDARGNDTKMIEFYPDQNFSITTHNSDKSKTKQIFNKEGKALSTTHINPHGSQTIAQTKQLIAWHEAGHSLSYMHNQSLQLIEKVTIQPDTTTNSDGHVRSVRNCSYDRTIEQLENDIISALCGGVAEQILLGQSMLTARNEILDYFSHPRFTTDMQLARKDARELIMCDWVQYPEEKIVTKIDDLITKLYIRAYRFIYSRQNEIKKIADKLLDQQTLSSDETYDLINMDKPYIF